VSSLPTSVTRTSALSEEPPRYLAYMLRMWQATSDGRLVWRASLESPHTGERQGFPDLRSLFEFLERGAEEAAPQSDTPSPAAPS
jgi:hypothetical protein